MMIKVFLLSFFCLTLSYANQKIDQDMDGVPDIKDECSHTPFFNEVNDKGCSINKLLPSKKVKRDSLNIGIGYGYANNEELESRTSQHVAKFQVRYRINSWTYSLRTGYYKSDTSNGMQDTAVKIKRKFKINPSLKVSLSFGVKLPTYDFRGNQTDYTLYSSMVYYPISKVSLFGGMNYTFINDEEITTQLQDTNAYYIGSGYSFNKSFYGNLSYSSAKSKFKVNDSSNSIITSFLYRINDKYLVSLSYSHELKDQLSHSLGIKLNYIAW